MKEKRILVVSQHYWPENFRITDLCHGFLEEGCTVDVLCGLPNYPKGEWFDGYSYFSPRTQVHEDVSIYRAGEIRRKGNGNLRIFLNYISFPLTALFQLPRIWGNSYDAVFCYETSPVLMMLPAIVYAKMHHIPLTTYVLDLWPENLYSVLPVQAKPLRYIAKAVSHWLYNRSNRLVAMSPALAEKLRAIAPQATIETIPQYCEDFYLQDVQDAALAQRFAEKFTIVFAGNISPAQDLNLLVQCAVQFKKSNHTDIHFVIVGDGMSRAQLEADIAANDVAAWFTFEGQRPVTDIPAYHTMADALFGALAKSDELGLTIPAKVTSYLAAGRPCLIAIDGEGARVVQQANAGLTSPAGDAQTLYENILKLAQMSAVQRATMGENGRKYCITHFHRKTLIDKMLQVILK